MRIRWKLVDRRWKALGAVAAISLAVLVPMQLASASETGSLENGVTAAGFSIHQGTITLRMNPVADSVGKSYFQYVPDDITKAKTTQTFKQVPKCAYAVNSSPASVVNVTSTGGSVGFLEKDNGWGLGVVSNTVNEGCGSVQINNNESLLLDFTPGLPTGAFLDYAQLDMELKYTNTILTITLYKGGTADANKVYTYARTCTQSDCGPDSGGQDNRRITVPIAPDKVLFDRMKIAVSLPSGATQAAATLEGGSDIGTSPSTFDVVTPAAQIVCDTPISPDLPAGATDATITFLTDPETGCPTGKAYALYVDTHKIELLTGGATTHIRTVVESDWAPQSAANPVPPTTVFPPAAGEQEVWCNGAYDPDAPDLGAIMPSGHTWCLITHYSRTVGTGQIQVVEFSLLEGDALRQH